VVEQESQIIERAAAAADREDVLRRLWKREIASECSTAVLVKLSAELRACEKAVVDLVARVNLGVGPRQIGATSACGEFPSQPRAWGLMARVARAAAATSGVYAFLADQEQAGWRTWEANVSRTHADGAPYPRQRILDGLRAGQTVNVPGSAMRGLGRDRSGRRPGGRAIVSPDDTIMFAADDMQLWLDENDL